VLIEITHRKRALQPGGDEMITQYGLDTGYQLRQDCV